MDEALLRRLLGAATLLLAAFVLAALLPDPGSTEGGGAVVAYDLRTGLPIGPAEPVPAPVERPPTLKPEEKLELRAAEPAAAPAPAPVAAAPLPRPALKVDESLGQPGGWLVQVASFNSPDNARNALKQVQAPDLPTKVQEVPMGKQTWYRLRVGPYQTEAAALDALSRIRKRGFPDAKLVRPEAAAKGN